MYQHPVPDKIMTLALLYKEGRVLLAKKSRGVGAGRWNGYGGKKEEGETLEQAMAREVFEESSVTPLSFENIGINTFHVFWGGKEHVWRVYIFSVSKWQGVPTASEEMILPTWFSEDEIPYGEMWQDDIHWLPIFFKDEHFDAEFWFDEKDTLIKKIVEKK